MSAQVLWVAHATSENGPGGLSLHHRVEDAIEAVVSTLDRVVVTAQYHDANPDATADPTALELLDWWFGPHAVDIDGGLDWGENWNNSAFVRPAAPPS